MQPNLDEAARTLDNMTTASERESVKRAMLHWLDSQLEYAPRDQLKDIAAVLNHWSPQRHGN